MVASHWIPTTSLPTVQIRNSQTNHPIPLHEVGEHLTLQLTTDDIYHISSLSILCSLPPSSPSFRKVRPVAVPSVRFLSLSPSFLSALHPVSIPFSSFPLFLSLHGSFNEPTIVLGTSKNRENQFHSKY